MAVKALYTLETSNPCLNGRVCTLSGIGQNDGDSSSHIANQPGAHLGMKTWNLCLEICHVSNRKNYTLTFD